MIRKLLAAIAFVGLVLSAVHPVAAAPITFDVTFDASNFLATKFLRDIPFPTNSVSGHFQVTLTPGTSASGTTGVSLLSIDPSPFAGPAPSFSYDAATDLLTFETDTPSFPELGSFFITGSKLKIGGFTTSPTFSGFVYLAFRGVTDVGFLAQVGHVSVTALPPVAATPIPAALPLLLSALGGLGLLGWRRRNTAAA